MSFPSPPLRGSIHPDIDQALVDRMVDRFYAMVRTHSVLGPIFLREIEDWPRHLDRMKDFWSSIMLMTGRYKGTPLQAHKRLDIDLSHFEHWLALWRETAETECPSPETAQLFVERAERIATSIHYGISPMPIPGRPSRVGDGPDAS
ncbi:MAG: group III truncated hemoglobin [Bauldia sp.]|nr:group III truncated hemoglobin [Bauldia sp.]